MYLLKARIHGTGKYSRLSLSAILNLLVCCETQHSNQNTHSHWLKREFRDIRDVLIYRHIPDWLSENSDLRRQCVKIDGVSKSKRINVAGQGHTKHLNI